MRTRADLRLLRSSRKRVSWIPQQSSKTCASFFLLDIVLVLPHYAPIPTRKIRDADLKAICLQPSTLHSTVLDSLAQPPRMEEQSKNENFEECLFRPVAGFVARSRELDDSGAGGAANW